MPQASGKSPYIATGRIIKPHGVLGWVRIQSLTTNPQRFDSGNSFIVEGNERGERLVLEVSQGQRGGVLAKFRGVDDRGAAGRLSGKLLLVKPEELGPSPEDAFWEHQLLGLAVETTDGRRLGEVTEVIETGANDVLVVSGEKEWLVPMIEDVIERVDLAVGMMLIRPLPGLLEE